jgi:hypothetical protein
MARYILYIVYVVYNLFYEAVSVILILYAETYLNGFLIPDKFLWNKDGTKREHPIIWATIEDTILLCMEGALLLILIYFINKWFLVNLAKLSRVDIILKWTEIVLAICTLIFICSIIFGFYFPLP